VPAARFELIAEPNGEAAIFQKHCTTCHDADRSLTKKKSLADWRITVRKMAMKEDADIPERVHESIAQYLAVHAGVGKMPEAGDGSATGGASSSASAKEKNEGKSKAEDAALIQVTVHTPEAVFR
jgi:hypothetical protein